MTTQRTGTIKDRASTPTHTDRPPCEPRSVARRIGWCQLSLGVLASLACAMPSANATVVLGEGQQVTYDAWLSDPTQSLQVGELVFTMENHTTAMIGPLHVVGFAPLPQPILGFDIVGPFGASQFDSLLSMQYLVEVSPAVLAANPGRRITLSALVFNGAASGSGAFSRINQSIADPVTGTPIAECSVFAPGDVFVCSRSIPAKARLRVTTVFTLGQATGFAFASFFRQAFEVRTVGACCGGTTCTLVEHAACAGPNTRFLGDGVACNPPGDMRSPCCAADFDQSVGITVQDVFAFLNAWFAGNPNTDFDGVNGLQVADIFAFLNAWFAGC